MLVGGRQVNGDENGDQWVMCILTDVVLAHLGYFKCIVLEKGP